jgi:hypothetical protein
MEHDMTNYQAPLNGIGYAGSRWFTPTMLLHGASWLGLVGVLAYVLVPGASYQRQLAWESTIRMERLEKTLESAKTVAPSTIQEVLQFLARHEDDCGRVKCDAALEARNRDARLRLKQLVDRLATAETNRAASAKHADPIPSP